MQDTSFLKNRNQRLVLGAVAFLYLLYHLCTLAASPLPWFDEICFTSMTQDYILHHTLFDTSRTVSQNEQVLAYGPVYFFLQSLVARCFGFGIFQFRSLNLLAGIADLAIVYRLCRHLRFSTLAATLVLVLLALDPAFNQDLHSGRMEFVTLFFLLSALLLFVTNSSIYRALFAGVLLGLAFLTTPRIVFAFSLFACLFIFECYNNKVQWKAIFLRYAAVLAVFLVVFFSWVLAKFGGISAYIQYYTHSPLLMKHVGYQEDSKQFRLTSYYLYLNIFVLACSCILLRKENRHSAARTLLLTFPAIIAFTVIVNSASDFYNALINPFKYVLIVGATIQFSRSRFIPFFTYGMAGLFALTFLFKAVSIFADWDTRDASNFAASIRSHISPGVPVSADYQYYYILQQNKNTFESVDHNGTMQEQMAYLEKQKVPYLVLNKYSVERKVYTSPYLDSNYTLVSTVEYQHQTALGKFFLKHFPAHINNDYACCIYRRKNL
jgi:Dolichyl-phosphate-mannose-protein mannosyltransferase